MSMVWGKKPVYHKLGYVAHFCPICRGPKPFEIKRVGAAGRLYFLSVGFGDLVGYERTCQECGTSLPAEPTDHAAIAHRLAPLPELTRRTFPQLEQVFAARLALEEQIRADPAALSADDRQALIRSPFLLMSAKVERRFARPHVDTGMGLAIAAAVALTVLGPRLVQLVAPSTDGAGLALFFLAIGLAAIVWQAIAARPRFVRHAVLPVLANVSELQARLGPRAGLE